MAIGQKINNVTERVIMTRDLSSEVELELFNGDSRGVHPMQFLNRVKEYNQFCNSNWEMKLLKVMKCFKGSPAVWAEVHKGCLLYTSRCV